DTYQSMMITFASASATILNSSAQAITVGSTSCAAGTTCTISPMLGTSSDTISTSPFPLTLASGTPVNLAIDFNTQTSLQSDLSVTPAVTVTSSSTALADGNLVDISGVSGQVTATGNNSVTITDANTGASIALTTSSNTKFNNFTSCPAGDVTC